MEGLKFVFAKDISHFLDGKSIDYHDGPRGGFSITDPGAGSSCGDCSSC
jgi:Fe-S cluster assembly iron-binding protein IscA